MNATIIIADINDALKKISACLTSETVTLKHRNGKVQMICGTKENYLSIVVTNSECEKGFVFTINKQILTGVLKGRKGSLDLVLNKKQHLIEFADKNKKYKGSLTCVPEEVEEVKVPDKGESVLIPNNMQKELQRMIKTVSLHDTMDSIRPELDIHIKLSPEGVTLNAFDSIHVARFMSKEWKVKKEAKFTIQGRTLNLILSIANGKKYHLTFTNGKVYAENDDFVFCAALIQGETSVTLKQVNTLFDDMTKPATAVTVDVKEFYARMENIVSIHESKGSFDLVIDKGKLHIRNSSNFGKIEDIVKGEVKGKDGVYAIDPHLLDDVLQCIAGEKVTLNLTPKKYIHISHKTKLGTISYLCNLM